MSSRWHVAALSVLLAFSVFANGVALGLARNAQNKLKVAEYTRNSPRVVPGEPVPPLRARTLDGRSVTVDVKDTDRPTLLYVFSPTCGWCKRNHESLEALIQSASSRYRIVAVSLQRQELEAYLAKRPTSATVLMEPDSATLAAYRLEGTPMTITISRAGVVENVWLGAYGGAVRDEVNRALGINLPEMILASSK